MCWGRGSEPSRPSPRRAYGLVGGVSERGAESGRAALWGRPGSLGRPVQKAHPRAEIRRKPGSAARVHWGNPCGQSEGRGDSPGETVGPTPQPVCLGESGGCGPRGTVRPGQAGLAGRCQDFNVFQEGKARENFGEMGLFAGVALAVACYSRGLRAEATAMIPGERGWQGPRWQQRAEGSEQRFGGIACVCVCGGDGGERGQGCHRPRPEQRWCSVRKPEGGAGLGRRRNCGRVRSEVPDFQGEGLGFKGEVWVEAGARSAADGSSEEHQGVSTARSPGHRSP